jgi:nucleoside-diphosphate-sugar epimerase
MSRGSRESILITGANGFVGSRLCRKLLCENYHVIAGVRDGCDGALIEDLDLEYRFGDVTSPQTLTEMVHDVDYIIHNAGLVKANTADRFFEVNHRGTENILQAAEKNKRLKKFVYISTMAAVGPSRPGRPLNEKSTPHPVTTYGRSKLAGEEEVRRYADRVNSVIIRPPAIYGPGDKEMFSFFNMLNNRIKPYLGNPKRKFQLVHVDDLAQGVSKALSADTKAGSIYFIAESGSYSYYRLVKYLRQAVGRAAIPIYVPGWALKIIALISERAVKKSGKSPMFTVEKADELLANWEVSVTKAEAELGFKSEISFPEGARQTVYWYRDEGWL